MGGEGIKGTVIPYESLISSEQAQKAAKQVENLIAEHQMELNKLNSFISENTNLINLVQRLPDELSHNIMVPFGKAAFFPGQLIHTNEFLVFIGEGYHVQKTSKQTKEFLQRREKFLGSEADSLKAMILELKGKASFFVDTAAEAEEGIVEIREDYIEDCPTERIATEADPSKEPNEKIAAGDEEYDRIWTIVDELEKQEREAESITEVDEDMAIVADSECSILQHSIENKLKISTEPLNNKSSYVTPGKPLYEDHSLQKKSDRSTFEDLKVQRLPKDTNMHGKSSTHLDTSVTKTSLPYPEKERLHVASTELEISKDTDVGPSSKNILGASKAFTGSVVEHSHGLHTNLAGEIATSKVHILQNQSPDLRCRKVVANNRESDYLSLFCSLQVVGYARGSLPSSLAWVGGSNPHFGEWRDPPINDELAVSSCDEIYNPDNAYMSYTKVSLGRGI